MYDESYRELTIKIVKLQGSHLGFLKSNLLFTDDTFCILENLYIYGKFFTSLYFYFMAPTPLSGFKIILYKNFICL